jgi:cytochrome c oxidase subunit 4
MEHSHQANGTVAIQKPNTGAIWRTFWILTAATTIEFIVAFTMTDPSMKMLRISIFLGLTIVKAFYIVGEFMHLKHEVKVLIWSIVLPTIFVVWFVIALMVEGDSVLMVR